MRTALEREGLCNVFYDKMNTVPPTQKPGKKTLDHVWATEGIKRNITKCGLVGQDLVFISDHMGMFVDIKVTNMREAEEWESRVARFLKTGNRKNVRRYLEYVREEV